MTRCAATLRRHLAAVRFMVVITVITGIAYPLAITGIAQLPGLRWKADGSLLHVGHRVVGSALIGQLFTKADGAAIPRYFQSRPSAAGAGYDPTDSAASNLGPSSVVDVLADPRQKGSTGSPSLLTQVCARSRQIGRLDGVNGARPYCTSSGVGAVLGVFWSGPGYHGRLLRVVSLNQECPTRPFLASYRGVAVRCARYGVDYSRAQVVAVRGDAPAHPAVPADAVTASGSGLDPDISVAYADLQVARVARARGVSRADVAALVHADTTGRALGFMGQPVVNVLELNLALDRRYPERR